MDQSEGSGAIDSADERAIGLGDAELIASSAAQADPGGGSSPTSPHGCGSLAMGRGPELEQVIEHQPADCILERVTPPSLVGRREWEFIGGAGQMGQQHMGVLRIDHRRFRGSVEQFIGMGDEPMIELIVTGDERGERVLALATGPTGLLPHGGDGAGETVEDADVQSTDIDAQLERAGGHDAAK